MKQPCIILASASPRRAELLHQIGVQFEVAVADIDETYLDGEMPELFVQRLAEEKAAVVSSLHDKNCIVIAADTIVVAGNKVLGKPVDFNDFRQMMRTLSASTHRVLTAVSVMANGRRQTKLNSSEVCFHQISENEISAYWNTAEPCDKAGGYAIQGRAAIFISNINGSYSGVMGLPLFETAELLAGAGLQILS